MRNVKIAITVDRELVEQVDELVLEKQFPTRSRAVQAAIRHYLERVKSGHLARECAKLDTEFEKSLAEGGLVRCR